MATKQSPPTRIAPNVADPLSELTIGRRQWAMYLQRGYNRNTYAQAMGVSYLTVDRWDTGKQAPELPHILRMVEVLAYSLNEIVYGYHVPRPDGANERQLTLEGIRSVLHEARASSDTTEAFGEYARSDAGSFQWFTRSYVLAFVESYAGARREDADRKRSIEVAKEAAANARANAEAATQRVQPLSAEQLAGIGARLRAKASSNKKRRAR